MCAGVRSQLGVYLTGAIAPADRAVLVRHLATCEDCRAELAGLASLPALLRRPQVQAAAQSPGRDGPGLEDTARGGRGGRDPGAVLLGRLLRSETQRRRRHRWLLAAAALLLAALAGTGWELRLAGPSAPATEAAGTILETLTIHGVTVLTDAEGYTLYWFGPDSATTSACVAGCARSWPPLTGPAAGGTGVNGTIGAIVRPDGSLQATYDGHPLYTATADTGPGQTRGNGVWSGGGVWHKVTLPGRGAPASDPSPAPSATGYGY
jgi:predicted lipoprotein with Yx(FWY)xxD motif